ncbi:transport protein [Salmonella bongori]|nr:transport protein [Salmonella bongori]
MVIYAIANTLGQIAALVFSIDAPLKVLLGDADSKYIPQRLCRTNASGTPVNGYLLTLALVAVLIMLPTLGIGDMNNLYKWLLNLNSVVMPLRYLWVFVAFIAVIRLAQKYKPEYVFIRNKPLALTVGIWCFAFHRFCLPHRNFPQNGSLHDGVDIPARAEHSHAFCAGGIGSNFSVAGTSERITVLFLTALFISERLF